MISLHASLPEADYCRFAVYELEFSDEDNVQNNKIFFINWYWSPDLAKIKSKTIYTSTKYSLRRELHGI
ncbi:ADF/Cofilin/Destrin [Trema orientale]|uniref:ADF/Cofilin/Destrin n=1 Tax=Trema orientale TaxID=63057 RepID=A0A2P5F0Y0_TREOI|nr:ADF/Cofilin/Destrin [Trema orientale]